MCRENIMRVVVVQFCDDDEMCADRTDTLMAKQYEQMKLPDRPKRWKQKAFEVMNEAVHTRQEHLLN